MKLASVFLAACVCTPILFAKTGPAYAAPALTWWTLTHADNPKLTVCQVSPYSPASDYEFQQRNDAHPSIDDKGDGVVELSYGAESTRWTRRYFRTEAACRTAEQAGEDNARQVPVNR